MAVSFGIHGKSVIIGEPQRHFLPWPGLFSPYDHNILWPVVACFRQSSSKRAISTPSFLRWMGWFQCHRGQANRGHGNVSGADYVVSWHTGDQFGVSGEFEVEVDDSSSDSCSSHCSGKHRLQPHSPPVLSSKRPITSSGDIRISREGSMVPPMVSMEKFVICGF